MVEGPLLVCHQESRIVVARQGAPDPNIRIARRFEQPSIAASRRQRGPPPHAAGVEGPAILCAEIHEPAGPDHRTDRFQQSTAPSLPASPGATAARPSKHSIENDEIGALAPHREVERVTLDYMDVPESFLGESPPHEGDSVRGWLEGEDAPIRQRQSVGDGAEPGTDLEDGRVGGGWKEQVPVRTVEISEPRPRLASARARALLEGVAPRYRSGSSIQVDDLGARETVRRPTHVQHALIIYVRPHAQIGLASIPWLVENGQSRRFGRSDRRRATMTRARLRTWALVGILAGALAWPGAVVAQPTKLPESMTRASWEVPTIVNQLRMAKQFGKTALELFEAMPPDDEIVSAESLGERAVRATRDTYVMIRAAKESLEQRRERLKYPDPVLELTFKKVFEAWNLARTGPDRISSSVPRSHYLPPVIRDTKRALQLVDQALVLMP
jgi:hypothetical protein